MMSNLGRSSWTMSGPWCDLRLRPFVSWTMKSCARNASRTSSWQLAPGPFFCFFFFPGTETLRVQSGQV